MVVRDETIGVELGHDVALARNAWARLRGLMLRRRLGPGQGLRIEPCSSIHMMFMLFPIDAVFYDRDGRVTKVVSGLRPWFGVAASGGSRGVLELPPGAALAVAAGHQLTFDQHQPGERAGGD